jgi:hypothetical protein
MKQSESVKRAGGYSPSGDRSHWRPRQAILLVALGLLLSYLLFRMSGGAEVADDAPKLIGLAEKPFALWGDYRSAGFSDAWGSLPPLLPLVFGLFVRPAVAWLGPFWGIRIASLAWSVALLVLLRWVLGREVAVPERRCENLIWIFVLLPSVIGAIALIPQEESYVALFALALYAAARAGSWRLVPALLVLAALAGKYFLLVLIIPLAFYSPRPVRNLVLWGGVVLSILTAYVAYHRALFGLLPIVGHEVIRGSSVGLWSLLWNLGIHLPHSQVKILSLFIIPAAAASVSFTARRRGMPLAFSFAATLVVTLILLPISYPAYVLWAIPFVLLSAGMMESGASRVTILLLLFVWGVSEWSANFLRGVSLALSTERSSGKSAVALAAERFLGPGFPFDTLHVLCIALVIACGVCMTILLMRFRKRIDASGPV